MNIHTARSLLLKTFIGFLVLTALIGIVALLTGDFGDTQMKTLGTTFTISAASVCAMACAAFIEKRGVAALGWIGIALNLIAGALVIFIIWTQEGDDFLGKLTITFIVSGLGFAHALLLQLPRLSAKNDWVQPVAAGTVGILALLILVALWGEIDANGYIRVIGVASVMVVLFTLVIPVLMFLAKSDAPTPALTPAAANANSSIPASATLPSNALVLTPIGNGFFRDAAGAMYRVEKVPEAKGAGG